jgi:hypothetical protein
MECSCEVNIDIDEWSEKIICETRQSEKIHKCDECYKDIQVGEKYELYKGSMDYESFTQVTCMDCISMRNSFFRSGYIFGTIWENLYEFLSDVEGNIKEECISTLTPVARDKVCRYINDIWMEHWLEYPVQLASRTYIMSENLSYWKRPGWIINRENEIEALNNFICNNI